MKVLPRPAYALLGGWAGYAWLLPCRLTPWLDGLLQQVTRRPCPLAWDLS